jgi:flagellar biosynthesis protein FliR
MEAADAQILAALPGWAFAFVLVLARVGAAVMLMPGLGEAEPPAVVRAGLAVALTALLLPVVQPMLPTGAADVFQAAGMVVAELLAGLFLGWLARLVALALPMAGQIIAYMLGLASVLQQDQVFNAQGTVLSRLFGLAAPVILLGGGLYALPLSALANSYQVLGPGAVLPAGDTVEMVLRAVGGSFGLALRLAAPFVLASVVWQMGLGLLARLVPQFQVFFVAQPAQILGGLLLLAALSIGMLDSWGEAARGAFALLPGL